MTAYGTVESAVEAMKKGAYDFVEKPLKRSAIVKTLRKAVETPLPRGGEPRPAGTR